ncbi:MAG: Magnesium transport protein CorA [Pelotomaculum sp. PtaB.Bin104]|nr:MAG: Magnesium transport protein CorA [Pelotomaculum sp. PtaB.Bin104]
MTNIYFTNELGILQEINEFKKGCWINLTEPTHEEIEYVAKKFNIDSEIITDALDEEEKSRIEKEDNLVLILVDIPVFSEDDAESSFYYTIPLGIIISNEYFMTVCLKPNAIINDFIQNKVKGFNTYMKTRFSLQLLYLISKYYLRYLKQINKKTNEIEDRIHKSLKNEELYSLLSIEKSLVYFATSLKANEIIMEKIMRVNYLKMYEEDKEIIEEVIIENKQAIEMAHIYSSILSGMMDAFASVISNNLNVVMKFLTSVTILLAIPTMIASFYGMNVDLPFQNYQHAFTLTLMISITLSIILAFVFARKKFF